MECVTEPELGKKDRQKTTGPLVDFSNASPELVDATQTNYPRKPNARLGIYTFRFYSS